MTLGEFLLLWTALMGTACVAVKIRSGGGLTALRTAWTGAPGCPSCRIPMLRLPGRAFPPPGYQVWICPRCTNALTTSPDPELPECPSCHQRSLLTPLWRDADAQGEPEVHVHEHCPICGHEAIEQLPPSEAEPRLGQVIPFPGARG